MLKNILFVLMAAAVAGCGTSQQQQGTAADVVDEHADFLKKNESANELFRVLISSERYETAQMRGERSIARSEDKGGDKYISSEIEQFNMIDEVCEAVFSIQLYPDSGKLSKIRTQKTTSLTEIDKLLIDDVQRWTFKFPLKRVDPTRFNIRYRVVLKKTKTESEILKEIQRRAREGG
ncbi:MAG: hypothetical protein LBT84_05575 [Spirochaetia bacterium]|jgi:hypothetical protein|nr:hypothetical protein [Spirochaetia bacterium]